MMQQFWELWNILVVCSLCWRLLAYSSNAFL